MNATRRFTIWLLLALLGLAPALTGCTKKKRRYVRKSFSEQPLAAVPAGPDLTWSLDLARIKSAPFANDLWRRFVSEAKGDPLNLQVLQETYAIDPRKDVSQLILAWYDTDNPAKRTWLAVVIGEFDVGSAATAIAAGSSQVSMGRYNEVLYYNANRGARSFSYTFLSPRELFISPREELILRVIELHTGATRNVLSDPAFVATHQRITSGSMCWAAGKTSARELAWLRQLAVALGKDPVEYAADQPRSLLCQANFEKGIDLQLTLTLENPETVLRVSRGITRRMIMAQRSLKEQTRSGALQNMANVTATFDCLTVDAKAHDFLAVVSLPQARFENTLAVAWELWAQLKAATTPSPEPPAPSAPPDPPPAN